MGKRGQKLGHMCGKKLGAAQKMGQGRHKVEQAVMEEEGGVRAKGDRKS
jgi:hypothetical protein